MINFELEAPELNATALEAHEWRTFDQWPTTESVDSR